jgi:NO-binding membrane sensor protein with MHYT domain/nitrogen-specific signal transduction histidine kinase
MMPHLVTPAYHLPFVILSVAIAIFASYTTLDLAEQVSLAQGQQRRWWILGGAVTMGSGIWAMHFVGMLATCLPVAATYDGPLVLLSMLAAIAAAGLALNLVSHTELGWLRLGGGSLLMGTGISSMHYIGMAALRMAAQVTYDRTIVGLSVAIAVGVSWVALWLAFHLRQNGVRQRGLKKILSACVMGAAIPTMHYTGMAAAQFRPDPTMEPIISGLSFDPNLLPSLVGMISFTLMGTVLLLSLETKVQVRTAALEQTNHSLAAEVMERTYAENILRQALEELKQTQAQLVQTEKMSSLGQLTAGVAHEINNPMNFISGNLKHLRQHSQDLFKLLQLYQETAPAHPSIEQLMEAIEYDFIRLDMPEILQSIELGSQRIQEIVLSMRNFSRTDAEEMKPANLHDGIESTLLILQHRLKPVGRRSEIAIVRQYGDLPLVPCHLGQLSQVFMNLLANAIDALHEQDEQSVEKRSPCITIETALAGDVVLVQISDDGPGIPAEVQAKLFEAFYTTKPTGKGTGLGLSISQQIVEEIHGGRLSCDSAVGLGTKFTIALPVEPFTCSRGEARAIATF